MNGMPPDAAQGSPAPAWTRAWTRATAPLGDAVLAYRRGGSGRALLYLHDAGADTLASPAFDTLAADHDVVLVDLPGYGGSSPPGPSASARDVAALLAALLDHLDWPRALVAGTSLGAWFALELALLHPQRVAGLLLAGAAGLQCPEDYLLALFRQGQAARSAPELIAGAIHARLPDAGAHDADGRAGAAVWGPWIQELAAAAWCSWHPYTANPRLLGRLGEVRCPTQIVWGARDGLIPLRHAHLLADGIPGARLRIVPDGGHLLALEHPDEFAAAVRRLPA